MWGYAGILSFGHAAYFGLGAYTYAIAAINIGESTVPLLLAIVLPALVAAVIGAMMFYGRISDVYLGVITLVVTLILFKFMNATAGDAYRIGAARLGGFNGIPAFPILNVPGDPSMHDLRHAVLLRRRSSACSAAICCARWILAQLLRPRADRHPRERSARRTAGLQRAGLQDRDLLDQRGDGRARRLPVRQLGRDRHARACSAWASRPRCIIWVDRRRPGHADRADARRGRCWACSSCCSASRPLIDNSLVLGVDPDPASCCWCRAAWRRRSPRWRARRGAGAACAAAQARGAARAGAGIALHGQRSMSEPVVETRDLSMRFGGVLGGRPCQLHAARARAALPDRPERRRQEHVLQVPDRPDRVEPCATAACSSAART